MTSSRSTDWISDFTATHGMPPFAGAEVATPGAPPAAAAPPPAAPAPAPAAAPPAPAPGQPPAPAAAAPPAAVPGAPVDPNSPPAAAEPAAAEPPAWAQSLLTRFDQIAPPPVDPMMVELGLAQAPAAPGQPPAPTYDPSQAAPQGQPQYGQPPATPGQQPPQPGQPTEMELVQRLIDERAQEQASRLIDERVAPLFAQQDANRRRGEVQSLQTDFPELAKPEAMQALFSRAQSWSTTLFGNPNAAREPGFLEIVHLAGKQLDAANAAAAVPGAPGVPGTPGEVPVEPPGAATPGAPLTPEQELTAGIMAERRGGGLSPLWVG